jgi:hypothetical protein
LSDCRHAVARIVAADDIPVAHRVMVRGEPEHDLERDVPVEAPIVSEDKLAEVGVDVPRMASPFCAVAYCWQIA